MSQNLTYLQDPSNRCNTFGVNTTPAIMRQLQRPDFQNFNYSNDLVRLCPNPTQNSAANTFKSLERQVALDLAKLQQILGGPPRQWRLHLDCQTSTTDLTKHSNILKFHISLNLVVLKHLWKKV